ncbi:MAG: ATP-binding cassette domain-containing protein [Acidimicrobiales bacterium]
MTEPRPDRTIDVHELDKTYPGDIHALRGLTFSVAAGTVFALLGPNGAGKSTTVKVLTTLSRADSGRAVVAGCDVADDPAGVRRRIGVVGQKAAVDLEATGTENLRLQGELYGLRGAALRRRVTELLDRFGLADAAGRVTRTYSGGMQRRLDVAMGLVHRPEVLFLDEPTTGLDPESRAGMWDEIGRLAGDEGLTVLLTTHYLEEADRLAHQVAIVDQGRIVAEGSPDALKAELRGDAIHVELSGVAPGNDVSIQVRHALAGIEPAARDVVVDAGSIHARVDSGAAALPSVLGALERAGLTVATATLARPSLDDVYLRHTGRALHSSVPAEPRDEKEVAA